MEGSLNSRWCDLAVLESTAEAVHCHNDLPILLRWSWRGSGRRRIPRGLIMGLGLAWRSTQARRALQETSKQTINDS